MAQFTCRIIDILTGHRTALLNRKDCERVDIRGRDRVNLKIGDRNVTATVDTTTTIVANGEVGITNDIAPELKVRDGDIIEVSVLPAPSSTHFVRKKIPGQKLFENASQLIRRNEGSARPH